MRRKDIKSGPAQTQGLSAARQLTPRADRIDLSQSLMSEFSPLAPPAFSHPPGPLSFRRSPAVAQALCLRRPSGGTASHCPTQKTLGNVHTISFSLPPCHRQAPENLYDEHVLCAFLDDGFLLADRTAQASCVVLVDIVREIARRVPRSTAITSLNLISSCLSSRQKDTFRLRTYASLTPASSFTFLVTRYSVIKRFGFLICLVRVRTHENSAKR